MYKIGGFFFFGRKDFLISSFSASEAEVVDAITSPRSPTLRQNRETALKTQTGFSRSTTQRFSDSSSLLQKQMFVPIYEQTLCISSRTSGLSTTVILGSSHSTNIYPFVPSDNVTTPELSGFPSTSFGIYFSVLFV